MCVIEKKTYVHSDGYRETVEKEHRCARATGSGLCQNVRQRVFDEVPIVEVRPSRNARTAQSDILITEGINGRRQVYKNLSKRSSDTSSIRRRSGASLASPVSTASSASSTPVFPVKLPPAPSPPPPEHVSPFTERERMPYPRPQPESGGVIKKDGTAVYDRPPSLEFPRAVENERTRRERRASVSSTTAEVNDAEDAATTRRRRRVSIAIDPDLGIQTVRPSNSSSSGSSRSERIGTARDQTYADSGPSAHHSQRQQAQHESHRRREHRRSDRGGASHNEHSAGSHRQGRSGEEAATAQAASRERHWADAKTALEGRRQQEEDAALIESQREGESAQRNRERLAAQHRELRERQYHEDRLSREAEALTQRSPTTYSARRLTNESLEYPPRSPISARTLTMPTIHQSQYPSVRRTSHSIYERGGHIIAQQQARVAHDGLADVIGDVSLEQAVLDESDDMEEYRPSGNAHRRSRREEKRRSRREEFWS